MKRIITLLSVVCLIFGACSDEKGKDPKLSTFIKFSSYELNGESRGGSKYWSIECDGEWTISDIPEWLKINEVKGSGNVQMEIEFERNTDYKERSGYFYVTTSMGGTRIYVKQNEKPQDKLSFDVDAVRLGGYEKLIVTLNVYSNTEWEIEEIRESHWLSIDKMSGNGDAQITVTAKPMDGWLCISRSDVLYFKTAQLEADVFVMQSPEDKLVKVELTEEHDLEWYTHRLCFPGTSIRRLKISGFIKENDFKQISHHPLLLRYLDMGNAETDVKDTKDIVDYICVKDTLILPRGIESLTGNEKWSNGEYASTSMRKLVLSNSVLKIGKDFFRSNSRLEEIKLSDNLKTIGEGAFKNCISLQKIDLPNSLTALGVESFFGCTELKEVSFSNKLVTIGYRTFRDCASLQKIDLPNSITEIGEESFFDCSGLKEVKLSNQIKVIKTNAFTNCTSLESITLPQGTESVEMYAFKNCRNLRYVEINGPTRLSIHSFTQLPNLEIIRIKSTEKKIYGSAFGQIPENIKLYVPVGMGDLYRADYFWRTANIIEE